MPQQVTTASGPFASKAAEVVTLCTSAAVPKADVTHTVVSSAPLSFQFGRTSILLLRPPHLAHPGASYAAMLIPYKLDLFM